MRKVIYILALLFLAGCPGVQQNESVINFEWSLRTSDSTGYWLRSTLSTPADSAKVFYYNAGRELLLIDYIYRKHPDSTYSYRLDFKSRWIQDKPTWKAITIAVQVYYNDSNYTYNTYVPVATIIGIVKKKDMATFKGIVNVSGLSGAVTNTPLAVVLDNMPADFWSTVTADGGDIRAYADAALTNELPREVVSIDTVAQTGVLWLEADTISNGEDIYITVDGVSANYADTATFGGQNVWANGFVAVYHMGQGDVLDSTPNGNHGTNFGTTAAIGQIGSARSFDGVDDYIDIPDANSIDFVSGADMTFSLWVNIDSTKTTEFQKYEGGNGYSLRINQGEPVFITWGSSIKAFSGKGTLMNLGQWYQITGVRDQVNGKLRLYVNGVLQSSANEPTRSIANNNSLHLGTNYNFTGDKFLNGLSDEIRISSVARSADWISLQYQNQADAAAFWTWTKVQTTINASAAITDGQESFSSTGQLFLSVDSEIADSPEKLQAAAGMLINAQTNLSDAPEDMQSLLSLLIGGQASITDKQEIFHATAGIKLTVDVSITDSPEQAEGIIILNFEPMHLITGVQTPNTLTAEGQKTPAEITIEGQKIDRNQIIT